MKIAAAVAGIFIAVLVAIFAIDAGAQGSNVRTVPLGAPRFSSSADTGGVAFSQKPGAKHCYDAPTNAVCVTYDGTSLTFSGAQPSVGYTGTVVMNFADKAGTYGCELSGAVTVTGAALGDRCAVGSSVDNSAIVGQFTCEITGANAAKVKYCGTGDPASATFTAQAIH